MRNIVEYPLEPKEILEALSRAIGNDLASGRVGGIDAHALETCMVFCATFMEELEHFVDEHNKRESGGFR